MILEALRGWLNRRADARRKRLLEEHNPLVSASPAVESGLGSTERTTFTVHKADNGTVLDYIHFTDDGRGGKYHRGVYIVPHDTSITEAVNTVLVANIVSRK